MIRKDTLACTSFKERIQSGDVLLGITIYSCSPIVIEVLGNCGFDYFFIDNEHTSASWETLEHMVRTAQLVNVATLVRVVDNFSSEIRKALEIGSNGVIIPHVNNKKEALCAFQSAKFPPEGIRGSSGMVRSSSYSVSDWKSYVENCNESTVVVFIIEDPEAVKNIGEILSSVDVNVVEFGWTDFCISAGLPDQKDHPTVQDAFDKVLKEAKRREVAVMTSAFPPTRERVNELVERGVTLLNLGNDLSNLQINMRKITKDIRSVL